MTRLLVLTLAFGAFLVGCATPAGTGLQNTTWKWTASTTTQPASQSVVPNPDNYTVLFKPNQTFEAKADCNQVSGQWATDTGNGLTITPGPSTMAACGPDSLAPQFVDGLSKTTNYVLDTSGNLVLTLGTEGTMTFKK
jgi:heat shock protein HslJ